jgi:hypothetical protein
MHVMTGKALRLQAVTLTNVVGDQSVVLCESSANCARGKVRTLTAVAHALVPSVILACVKARLETHRLKQGGSWLRPS